MDISSIISSEFEHSFSYDYWIFIFCICELPNYFLYVVSIEVLTLFLSGFMDNFNTKATHILQIFSLVGRKLLIMEWI